MKKQTSEWYKCRTAKVISKDNKILLDIMNADRYKVENGWLFIKDCYDKIHHFPANSIKEFISKL